MRKLIRNLTVFLLVGLIMACTPKAYGPAGDTESLAGLKAMSTTKRGSETRATKASQSKIREQALRETALSIGAQSALASRAKSIDDQLVKQTRHLDAIFDFKSLILDNNILPPVLLQGNNSLNLADGQTIRISDRTYKLVKQARFMTTPPNWRQYLWLDYKKPDPPHVTMLPNSKEEREVWCYYTEKGWQQGLEQADIILAENVARIKEDFTGMILYRKLLAMNMVSPPYVSHLDLGVTGDGNELHIDDQVLRITALPALNVRSDEWRAAVAKDEGSLEALTKMEQRIQTAKVEANSNAWQPVIRPVR
ncbi:MAG: type IV secretion system DotC family protein [Legionellaceae bacterium]|nr:type IV secretion system DotC family protein [Legionellaceae bacterium]